MEADNHFGPDLPGIFDFTLLFEQSILSLLPTCLFIVLASWRVSQLFSRPQRAKESYLLWAKLGLAAIFGVLQIALLVLWCLPSTTRTKTSIADPALAIVEAIAIAALSYMEHVKSTKPSVLLSSYLILTIILDVALTRTFWLRSGIPAIAGVFTTSLAIKIALLVLEECPKTKLATGKKPSRESSAGVISRTFFWWLNRLLLGGSRQILTLEDLDPIHEKFDSTKLSADLETLWEMETVKTPISLLSCTVRAFKWQLLAGVPPRLLWSGFTYAQPFLIDSIIRFLATPEDQRSMQNSSGLIGATVLVYLGLAVTNVWYKHVGFQLVTMWRGGLVSLMFKKTLRLKTASIKDNAPVTLMSTDMDVIAGAGETFHDIWGSLVDLPVGIYLLYRQVGVPSLFVLIPTVLTLILSIGLGPAMEPATVKWNEGVQKRVGESSNMLNQMKGIKMMGLTPYFHALVGQLRVKEIMASEPLRRLVTALSAIANVCAGILPMIVILASIYWSRADQGLSIAVAFTSLSIIALVTQPLTMIIASMMQIGGVVGGFGRIQAFLELPEQVDGRISSAHDDIVTEKDVSIDAATSSEAELRLLPPFVAQTDVIHAPVVKIEEATFTTDDDTVLLQDISLEITKATLNMIVGRVGCGKSCLIKAITGELCHKAGSVTIARKSVAYCDQTAWLRNATVRANIINQSSFEEKWLETVIQACALEEDIERFPNGDETLVGSGGIALSGGQKQRVALARALYSRKDILILDDVFSGLDNTTSRTVFQRLLGPAGLLRLNRNTVILATSDVNFLPAADFITVIEVGRIAKNQVRFDSIDPLELGLLKDKSSESDSDRDDDKSAQPRKKVLRTVAPIVTEEELARQTGDTDCYVIYLRSWGWHWVATIVILSIIGSALDVMPNIWVRLWVENGAASRDGGYTAGYIGFSLAAVLIGSFTVGFFLLVVMPKSGNNLHEDLLTAVTRAPLYFYTGVDSGNLLNRFSQDMTLVDQNLPLEFISTFKLFLAAIAQTGVVASGSNYVGAVIPPSLLVLYLIQKYYLRTSRQMRLIDLEAKTPLYSQFTEMLAGLPTVRAFGWSSDYFADSMRLLDSSQKPFYTMFCIQRWLQVALDLFVAGMALVLVSMALRISGSSTQASIGLAMVNLISFNMTLSLVLEQWTRLETSLGAIARLKWFTANTPNENKDGEKELPLSDWPAKGRVELKNVSAAYSDEMETVVKDLTLTIEPGQKVGVCGRSGSGKSSFVLTLLRLLELQSGTIYVDGVDLATVPRQHIRSHFTTIPQDPVKITGTIRNNLDPEGHIQSDDVLIRVLEKTSLWSLVSARGGLDADASEVGLSVGQQQLFCLARSLLSRNKLVLLDEATSSVDRTTDEEIRRIVREEMDGCTVIEVAHRLDVVKDFDLVIVMSEGVAIEVGNPRDLLGGSSAFRTLWEHQGL